MPAGLQVINDYGSYQITDSYKNHVLADKASVVVPGNGLFTVATAAPSPVLAFQGARTAILGVSISGGVRTYKLRCSAPGSVVTVFIFGAISGSAGGSPRAALQVFAVDGSLSFDSDYKYMRVIFVGQIPGPHPILTSGPGPMTSEKYVGAPGGPAYAVFLPYQRFGQFALSEESGGGPGGSQAFYCDAVGVSGATGILGGVLYRSDSGGYDTLEYQDNTVPPPIFFVDVTNM